MKSHSRVPAYELRLADLRHEQLHWWITFGGSPICDEESVPADKLRLVDWRHEQFY
jgi:hypothetical protein